MMEGRETDLEYNLLMGLTGASVSKHLLDEHFTLLWANDFYYDMIGYPKEEYEALFHNKPDLYFKGYDEAWNILSKNVYETIANKASGYETVIQMPTRKGKRWTKITSTFTDQVQDGIPISYTVMTDVEDVMRRRIEQTITYDNIPGFISKHKVHKDGSFTLLEANDKYMDFSGIDKNSFLSFSPFSRLDETSRNTMNAHISCMLKGERQKRQRRLATVERGMYRLGRRRAYLSYRLHQYHRHYRTEGVAKETGETVKAT